MLRVLNTLLPLIMAEGEGGGGGEGDPPADGDKNREHMIPKARFDEVLSKLRTLEEKQAEAERKAQSEAEAKLAEEQKWAELSATREQERNQAQAELAEAQARLASLQRQQEFVTEALAQGVPGDRTADAFQLVREWPEGADTKAVVKGLLKEKPWLLQPEAGAPDVNPKSGKGGSNGQTEEEIRRQKDIEAYAKMFAGGAQLVGPPD